MKLKRRESTVELEPVIVLVDVVFFLLVFFMLISRLDATAPFEVSPPVAASGRNMPAGGITISISQRGGLAVDGAPTDRDKWLSTVRGKLQQDEEMLIRVNAHAATELRHVLPILNELEKTELGDVVVVVTPGE